MGQIQSSVGLVTGIAIEDTVNQLMALNAIPRDRLQGRNAALAQEQVALAELTALVVGVQLTTDRLGQSSLYSATNVNSSDPAALRALSSGSPKPGNYSFVPVRQAQSQQLTSSLYASSAQTLREGEFIVHTGGFLDESVSLDALNGGQGIARGFIKITDRSGTSETIDLRFAQTANDVVDAINTSEKLGVVASLHEDKFVLSDVSGGSGNLQIADVPGGTTAEDLGLGNVSTASATVAGKSVLSLTATAGLSTLLDGRGLEFPNSGDALEFQLQDGSKIQFATKLDSSTASLGQLIDAINEAGEGKLKVTINTDGKSLEIADLTTGSSTFAISSPSGTLAEQLGLTSASDQGVIQGGKLVAGLSDVLLSSLNGGQGLGELGMITITDRNGGFARLDLSEAQTLGDVLSAINESSASVQARLNSTKTGIEVIDTSGSTDKKLKIQNDDDTNSATALQIEGDYDADSVDSGSLNRQFVSRNTTISEFNQGRGVSLGSIAITDSAGLTSTLNLRFNAPNTIGDVIDKINALSVGVEARINETGDGLILIDTAGGNGTLTVEDVDSGSAAQQLGIAGRAETQTVGESSLSAINGSLTWRIPTTPETTISDLIDSINDRGNAPISANLIKLSDSGGVRVLLNATSTGQHGRVAVSGTALNFSETAKARDALLAFGATESSGGVLVASSNNTFTGLVDGLEFTVGKPSDAPVTVSVTENQENVTKQIELFVNQFNSLRDKLAEFTAFDERTQSVGVLFGKNSALRTDLAFGRLFSGSFVGVGSIRSLGQIGIRLNDDGKLAFDKSKFNAVYAEDPAAVKDFFTTENSGFSARSKAAADSLAGVENGALLNRTDVLNTKIEQNSRRIETFNVRLDRQRTRLLNQFYNMETAIAKLQQNLSSLNQLQVIPPLGS